MRYLLIFILLFSRAFCADAQILQPQIDWLTVWGEEGTVSSSGMKQLDGGFVICLETNALIGNIDSLCNRTDDRTIFMKYNADASVLEWTKCYHSSFSDSGFGFLYQLNSGNYILGGLGAKSTHKFLIHKEDGSGLRIWSKEYGDSAEAIIRSMLATSDGGYIMVGEVYYTSVDFPTHYGSWMDPDIAAIKVDSNGEKVWSKVFGGTGYEYIHDLVSGPNNGCYILGTTNSDDHDLTGNHGGSSGSFDAYVLRLDEDGNIIWHKDLGGDGDDGAASGWPDGKGGLLVGATSGSHNGDVSHQVNYGGNNFWALHIDSSGTILWDNSYGGGGDEFTSSICVAEDNSIWITGDNDYRDSFEVDTFYGGQYDAWLVHADSNGNFLSEKVIGGPKPDGGEMVYPLSNNNVIVGGYCDSVGGVFPPVYWNGGGAFLAVLEPTPVSVDQVQLASTTLSIYPNPVTDEINISWLQPQSGKVYLSITTITGRQVYNGVVEGATKTIKIKTNDWNQGVYFLSFNDGAGAVIVRKIVIL